ncbi:MAG: DUF362 domain-containing protein [Verrucomicrobiae bacterium]|nr:DUF362 domain-containing protein [Verrucomicrobiae bacterium]
MVVRARDEHTVRLFKVDAARTARLVNAAVARLAGEKEPGAAWRRFVSPGDRVGIKILTSPGPVMSTRREVVDAVIEGLRAAGVSPSQVIVFDRDESQMEAAGYRMGRRADGATVTATLPERGYDPAVAVDLVPPGKLIWGDCEFRKEGTAETDQVSSLSHFSQIVTKDVDRLIGIAPLMSDARLGLYGCRLNSSLGVVDNFRRLLRATPVREDSLTDLFGSEILKKKCVLHLLDGLIGQFAGGPAFDPSVCWPHQAIYAGRDPLALDRLALHEINLRRPEAKIEPAELKAPYLDAAAEAGLGVADPKRITLIEVAPTD